ncbi:MAG: serine/threonine protein phosphatase [Ruminococcaceae bacterium]|nr:serine/threonine protein phosphatase [Oscillospiraceae bacterium]
MTYVVSNIHGNYEKFKQLLSDIRFKDSDVMYILGDMVDYGEDPIGLICDVSMRYNVLPILGEADYNALELLTALDKMLLGSAPDGDALTKMTEWMANGGATTIEGFKALDADMREGVIDYLSDMALYEEVSVGGKDYLLVHAGISDFDPDASLDDYMPEDFISSPLSPDERYFDGVTVIVGHIPTSELGGNNRIFYGESSIHIDCGAAFDGALGCLRLEDGKEFYV